jgi:SpoIID/LytB domain protein
VVGDKFNYTFLMLIFVLALSACSRSIEPQLPVTQDFVQQPEFPPDIQPSDMEKMKTDYINGQKQKQLLQPAPQVTDADEEKKKQPLPTEPLNPNDPIIKIPPFDPPIPKTPPPPTNNSNNDDNSPVTTIPRYTKTPTFNVVRTRLYPLYKRDVPYMDPFVANSAEKKITLSNEAGLLVYGLDSKNLLAQGKQVKFDFTTQGIYVDGRKIYGLTRIEVVPVSQTEQGTTVHGLKASATNADGTFRYDGSFSFTKTNVVNDSGSVLNTWNILNFVYLEDYIQSVTPSEVPAKWVDPAENAVEAVKAQSIAARSYGLNTIATSRRASTREWDVVPTTLHQAYLGVRTITSETRPLVETTSGQIVVYDNKVILAVFSANSGGYTCSSYDCWGNDVPYLQAIEDAPEVRNLPGGKKPSTIPTSAILTALKSLRVITNTRQNVESISAFRVNTSQRVTQIQVVASGKTHNLNPAQTTHLIKKLSIAGRYLDFSTVVNDQVVVSKLGFGHAIGMSQWGAYAFSRRGLTYQQILQHYYKDTQIISLAD